MTTTEYRYIFRKVQYPEERGYRWKPFSLPDWIHLCIEDDGESKRLIVHSRIHVTKVSQVGPDHSIEFTDREIIRSLSGKVSYRYL